MEDINLAALVVWLETQSGSSRSFPDLSEILHRDLSRLMDIDGKMQKIVSDIKCLMGVARKKRLGESFHEDKLMMSGSVAEGCMLARWFRPNPPAKTENGLGPALLNQCNEKQMDSAGCDAFRKSGSDKDPNAHVQDRRNEIRSVENDAASLLEGLGIHKRDVSNIARGVGVAYNVLGYRNMRSRNEPHQTSTFTMIMSNLIREFTVGSPASRPGSTGFEMLCPNPEIELDIMYMMGSVPEMIARDAIHSTHHGPAYVTIKNTNDLDQLLNSLLRAWGCDKDSSWIVTDDFLDSQKFKEFTWQHVAYRDSGGSLATVLSLWLGVPVENISIDAKEHPSRTSHQTQLSIRITDTDRLAISLDHVPSMHIPFWPDVAKGYLTRKRNWPESQHTVESITQRGCHLVPRASEDGDQRREFRLSFSTAEITLKSLMTKAQHRVYMLFKVLYYRYLKPLGDSMESYFAKTVMLWTAEEYPPSHPIWSKDALLHAVHFLLLRLQVALYRWKLPMFFIPEINLIEKLPKHICADASQVLTAVRKQLLLHVPVNMAAVVAVSEAWHTRLDGIYQIARPLREAEALE